MKKPISILHDGESCYLCGRNGCGDPLDWHHVFGGANKKIAERYGLKVRLCHNRCHIFGKDAVHQKAEVAHKLQEEAQLAWEENYGDRAEFMRLFGRNYVFEDVEKAV